MFFISNCRELADSYKEVTLSGARSSLSVFTELTDKVVEHIDSRLNNQGEVQQVAAATILTSPKSWPIQGSEDVNGNFYSIWLKQQI